ncbi:MAG: hcaD [Frankiales bacterium]|nr:hcaD [Frankiales bacterium]
MSENTPDARRLVVVGAGLAGLRACETARRGGHAGPIVLVGSEVHLPYDRPPLSKEFLDVDGAGKPDPHLQTEAVLRDELDIDVRTGTAALGLDVQRKVLLTGAGELPYDALVVATGAAARTLPGSEQLAGVLALRTLDDAHALRLALEAGARTVVVGAGFIGSEVASAASKRGLDVTVVEALGAPLVRSLGVEVGALCSSLHTDHGTDLRLGVGVAALHPREGSEADADGRRPVGAVVLTDGTVLPADLVVVGVGCVPSTAWLADSGLQLHERDGGIVCDENLQALDASGAPVDGVFAAGDVAHWHNALFDRTMRLEHWTSAAEQGAAAATNALAEQRAPYVTVPYFWSDWYGTRLQFVGVPTADEVVVQQRTDAKGGTAVLYRQGETLVGALTLGRPDLIMKYRRMVKNRAPWDEGLGFGASASTPAPVRTAG